MASQRVVFTIIIAKVLGFFLLLFHLPRNCLFCMFDGDDKILYLVFSISATEILNAFRMKLMEKQKNYKI